MIATAYHHHASPRARLERVARVLGCTVEEARQRYRDNSLLMRRLLESNNHPNITAAHLQSLIARAEELGAIEL